MLEAELSLGAMPRSNTHLIVAVPRPQSVKKLIQVGCAMGLSSLTFIRAANIVKSYLQSKSLTPANIQGEVIKGLEQANDSVPPEIRLLDRSPRSIGEAFPAEFANATLILADTHEPAACDVSGVCLVHPANAVYLAIGPETGWTPAEVGDFKRLGFQVVTLGLRMLRVEVAATVLISQVTLLRQLPATCQPV